MNLRESIEDLATASAGQVVLRCTVVAGAGLVLLATTVAAGRWNGGLAVALLGAALLAGVRPDAGFALAVVAIGGVGWIAEVDDRTTPWSVLAAVGLLLVHTAAAAASTMPVAAAVPGATARRWLRRTALAAVAAPVAWVLVRVTVEAEPGGAAVLAGVAGVSLAVTAWWLGRRSA